MKNHMREFMSLYLRKEGYQVIEAVNGNDALKQFNKYDIDLVVLDIMMPVIDGFEVCKSYENSLMFQLLCLLL